MLTTDQKGAIADTAIAHEAAKLGIGVLKPVNEGLRYDLVLVPMSDFVGQQHIQLRLAQARNNQRRGILWAKDWEFAAKLAHLGP